MKVKKAAEVQESPVNMEGTKDTSMRLLLSEQDGAPNFAMRMFTVKPGGHTPFHFHNYEHEVYVLAGRGVLKGEDREHVFEAGDVIFVAPNEKHQFRNAGDSDLQFLCLIPAADKCG